MPPPIIATQAATCSFLDITLKLMYVLLNLLHRGYDLGESCISPICFAKSITALPKSFPQYGQSNSKWSDMLFGKKNII